jgi:hypothetical protein
MKSYTVAVLMIVVLLCIAALVSVVNIVSPDSLPPALSSALRGICEKKENLKGGRINDHRRVTLYSSPVAPSAPMFRAVMDGAEQLTRDVPLRVLYNFARDVGLDGAPFQTPEDVHYPAIVMIDEFGHADQYSGPIEAAALATWILAPRSARSYGGAI